MELPTPDGLYDLLEKGRAYWADDETVEAVADDWADYDEDNYGYLWIL